MRLLLLTILFTFPFLASAAGFEITIEDTLATVYVVPDSAESVYTAQAVIAFDETTLSVENITVAPGWIPLTQEGYDSFVHGQIIKTAGYPKGITEKTPLLTFSVTKHAGGVGVITVEQTSVLYDKEGKNIATRFDTEMIGSFTRPAATLPPAFTVTEDSSVVVEASVPIEEVSTQINLPAAVISVEGAIPVVPLVVMFTVLLIGFGIYTIARRRRARS